MKTNEQYTEHEVRIRMLERIAGSIESRFQQIDAKFMHLENKIDNQFKWIIGTIVTLFGTMILTKLI